MTKFKVCKTCKRQLPICGECGKKIREEFPFSYCDTCEVKWEVRQVYESTKKVEI